VAETLDSVDTALIRELQVDGRVAYSRLAPLVGMSEAAVRQRVNRLQDHGVIQIVAVTDPAMLGLGLQAMVGINVDRDVRDVAKVLADIEAVDYLVITAGRYEILAEVFSTDATEFLKVVNEQIRCVEGVRDLEILTYLDLVKQTYNWGTG